MKIFIEKKVGIGEEEHWEKRKECSTKEEAKAEKKINERIHLCFHDEENPKSCIIL